MTVNYTSPNHLAACRLSPRAPFGLFRSLTRTTSELLWIVGSEDDRYAIVVEADDPRWLFDAFQLTEDSDVWEGLHLGLVEVLVDAASARFQQGSRSPAGAISINAGELAVTGKLQRATDTRRFRIGTSAEIEGAQGASFSRWQLVQHGPAGEMNVLYSRED